MAIINKGTAFSNGEQLSAGKLNDLVDGATFGTDSVDNASTIVNANGAITVRDSGVTAAKLATGAVTTNTILDANVTTAKIADANVTTAKIADANVTFAKLTDVIDDDTMATATDTTLATSESIKAYVDVTLASSSSFTTEDGQSAGYQVFPSGLKMAWGDAQVAVREDPVTFPAGVNFTVAPTVTITMTDINFSRYSPSALNVTTTKFDSYSQVATDKSRYFAIGH